MSNLNSETASSPITENKITHATDWTDRIFRWRYLLLSLLPLGLLSFFLYQQGRIAELQDELTQTIATRRRQESIRITENRQALVLPVNPHHPRRLSGRYYRGNDERDSRLFNGGVYRTAIFDLSLVDENSEELKWHDTINDRPLFISLTITRAPRTTRRLFTPQIFQETYLRRFRETEILTDVTTEAPRPDESGEVGFFVVKADEVWESRVPLEPVKQWKDGRNSGVIYLFYGSQIIDGFRGRAHYGIRYDLKIENGKLSPDSHMWMGIIYDLGGRVLIPQEKEIPLHDWFDYRPLPEIEVDNPNDSELLGLPEHLEGQPSEKQ